MMNPSFSSVSLSVTETKERGWMTTDKIIRNIGRWTLKIIKFLFGKWNCFLLNLEPNLSQNLVSSLLHGRILTLVYLFICNYSFISITNNKHVCFCLSFSFLIWISGKFLANGPFALKTRFVHPNTSFLLDFREGKNVRNIFINVFHDLFLQLVLLTLLLRLSYSVHLLFVDWSEKTWNHTKSTLLVYVQVSCLLNPLVSVGIRSGQIKFNIPIYFFFL